MNADIDFLILSDCDFRYISIPNNVTIKKMQFSEIQQLVFEKTSGGVLPNPYKLCDYRPAYGDIFSEYLQGYDWYGWCDCDMALGSIRGFITDEILQTYDKIGISGFFVLMKNSEEIRLYYKRTDIQTNWVNFNEVKRHKCSFAFDEKTLMNDEFGKRFKLHTLRPNMCGDTRPRTYNFNSYCCDPIGKELYHYQDGHVFRVGNNYEKEVLFVHWLKRILPIHDRTNYNDYWVAPNGFYTVDNNSSAITRIAWSDREARIYEKKYRRIRTRKIIFKLSGIYGYYIIRRYVRTLLEEVNQDGAL
ncbi:hypothetical protein FACS1894184_03620 [Clostridia bacterium]|nr:hypothetical protein FACS1894184_03620 [Clostridia bacterium]